MSRPWGFCERSKFGYSLYCEAASPGVCCIAVMMMMMMMFLSSLQSLQSCRAAQHQSHRLCQSCHLQSPPVWQLIGAAGCRSCRDWSVCSLISCNPLVIPLGSNISISPPSPPLLLANSLISSIGVMLMLGIRAENIRCFPLRTETMSKHNSSGGEAAVMPSYWFWQTEGDCSLQADYQSVCDHANDDR